MKLKQKFSKDKCVNYLFKIKGSHFNGIVELPINKILIPKGLKNRQGNLVRYQTDQENVNNLRNDLKEIDYTCRMIVIKKIRPTQVNGITYEYELVDGFHRMAALKANEEPSWLFAIYSFDNSKSEYRFRFKLNNHPSNSPNTPEDIANFLSLMVAEGHIENTEEAMREEMKDLSDHIHGSTVSAGIKKAVRQNGTYVDIKTYDYTDIKEFINENSNYNSGVSTYVVGGNIDPKRNELGWTIKEGYEAEFVMNAMKGLTETGKPSYFLLHTKTPTEQRDLETKRADMLKSIESIEHRIEEAIAFKNKTGQWPWRVEAYFPQDNRNKEYKFISPRK